MSDPSLISHISGEPSLGVARLLALPRKPTALCHSWHQLPVPLILFHQEAFKRAAPLWRPGGSFCFSSLTRSEWCHLFRDKDGARRRGGGGRGVGGHKGGWNNLNKTEGQSNNKMSISPLAVPDVNFLFLQTCSAVRMRGGVAAAFK